MTRYNAGDLVIYRSGDAGSADLIAHCNARGVKYKAIDIRSGVAQSVAGLQKLMDMGLRKVPQVFFEDGRHVGGFDEAMAVINKTRVM